MDWGYGEDRGRMTKGCGETSGADGYVHSIGCGIGFMTVDVYISKLNEFYTFNMYGLLWCQLYLNKAIIETKQNT